MLKLQFQLNTSQWELLAQSDLQGITWSMTIQKGCSLSSTLMSFVNTNFKILSIFTNNTAERDPYMPLKWKIPQNTV